MQNSKQPFRRFNLLNWGSARWSVIGCHNQWRIQSVFDGWVIAQWLARWPQQWWGNVSEILQPPVRSWHPDHEAMKLINGTVFTLQPVHKDMLPCPLHAKLYNYDEYEPAWLCVCMSFLSHQYRWLSARLLTHWSYYSLALSHRYNSQIYGRFTDCTMASCNGHTFRITGPLWEWNSPVARELWMWNFGAIIVVSLGYRTNRDAHAMSL